MQQPNLQYTVSRAFIVCYSIPLVKVDKLPSGADYRAMIEQRYGGLQQANEYSLPLTNYHYVRLLHSYQC